MKILVVIPHVSLLNPEGHLERLLGCIKLLPPEEIAFLIPHGALSSSLTAVGYSEIYLFKEPRLGRLRIPYFLDWSPHFKKQLKEAVAQSLAERIIFDFPWGLSVGAKSSGLPCFYFSHGVESEFTEVTLTNFKINFFPVSQLFKAVIKFIESRCCKCAKSIFAISAADKDKFAKLYKIKVSKLVYLPQPTKTFTHTQDRKSIKQQFSLPLDKTLVVFHGSKSHLPNREALTFITEKIAPAFLHRGDLFFVLAGTGWEKERKENLIQLGFVPNLKELLSVCDIALMPLFKTHGMQMKLLDYFSVGVPILCTTRVLAGLSQQNRNTALSVGDNAEDFISALNDLLDNTQRRSELAQLSKQYLREHHDPEKVKTLLLNAIDCDAITQIDTGYNFRQSAN